MLLEIQIFNVEKKHDEAHNTKIKTEIELQINFNLLMDPTGQIQLSNSTWNQPHKTKF